MWGMHVKSVLDGTQPCFCGRPFSEHMDDAQRQRWVDQSVLEEPDHFLKYWHCSFTSETQRAELHGQDDYYGRHKST